MPPSMTETLLGSTGEEVWACRAERESAASRNAVHRMTLLCIVIRMLMRINQP